MVRNQRNEMSTRNAVLANTRGADATRNAFATHEAEVAPTMYQLLHDGQTATAEARTPTPIGTPQP